MITREQSTIRRSVVAGSWYPGTEQGLLRTVDGYLGSVDQAHVAGDLFGLISPHAGYSYSGQTAAHAYNQLRDREAATVVIVGPSHRAWVAGYAVSAEEAYETPLGRVPLDGGFIADLAERVPVQRIRHDAEHSLEIQLPFLQRQLGEFSLVPILMSTDDPVDARRLAAALVEIIRGRAEDDEKVLLVASSDLHHIEDYDATVRRDRAVVDAVAAFDLERLTSLFGEERCSVCGRMPILAVLHATTDLGADSVEVLHHTNSGDVTGKRSAGHYTVGYLAAAIYRA
jgi:AmmeMemoRadiSam system protein B